MHNICIRTDKSTLILWMYLIVLWSLTYFGYSRCHLQGDFCENKNTIIMKVCLNHSTVLKIHMISVSNSLFLSVQFTIQTTTSPNNPDYNSSYLPAGHNNPRFLNNYNSRYFYNHSYVIILLNSEFLTKNDMDF